MRHFTLRLFQMPAVFSTSVTITLRYEENLPNGNSTTHFILVSRILFIVRRNALVLELNQNLYINVSSFQLKLEIYYSFTMKKYFNKCIFQLLLWFLFYIQTSFLFIFFVCVQNINLIKTYLNNTIKSELQFNMSL